MTTADLLTEIKADIDEVYNKGVEDNYLTFWNIYTNNNTRTYYRYAFSEQGWTKEIFNPPYTIYPTDCRYMFQNTGITEIDETQVDFSNCSGMRDAFYSANVLVSLRLKIRSSATYNANTFGDCESLKNLTIIGTIGGAGFDVSSCINLSADSIRSILEACKKKNSGLTITLPSEIPSPFIEGETADLQEMCESFGSPVNEAYTTALANGYTISFN